jgi:plasmid stability protein
MGKSEGKDGVTIYLPSETHRRLKVAAATQGTSVSNIVEALVSNYLLTSDPVHPPVIAALAKAK